jgi:hypothetical protein
MTPLQANGAPTLEANMHAAMQLSYALSLHNVFFSFCMLLTIRLASVHLSELSP